MALGKKLKEAREAMGLTESDVAESTHMMTQMIREIEAEDYSRFSAPIYGKGFIKLYAKAVGLDPDPLVAEFMAAMSGNGEPASKPSPAAPVAPVAAVPGATEPETPATEPSPAPAAPAPRHVYAKASVVTMPSTDAPHPMPMPTRPTSASAQAAPPARPVASAPSSAARPVEQPAAPVATDAPPASAAPAEPVVESAPPAPASTGFRLEAEPMVVNVVPPQPVSAPARPFQHPMPKQASRPAVAFDEDDDDSFTTEPRRRRPARQSRPNPLPELIAELRSRFNQLREHVAAFHEKPDVDDDDHAPLGDETPNRRRWWIAAGVGVVLAFILLANRGGDDSASTSIPSDSDTVQAGLEPIVDAPEVVEDTPEVVVETPPAQPAEEPVEATPMMRAEIVRVLPPPKCFAR